MTGPFDVAFVVVHLFPLLIFALSYNLLSEEREQGTMKILLAQPLSRSALVTGKIALRAVVLLLLVVLLPAGIILATRPDVSLLHLLLWAGLATGYGLSWFALAVAVNSLGKSSATNATILISSWVGLVLVVPVALNILITTVEPVSSRAEMITRLRDALSDLAKRHDAIDFERSNFDRLSLITSRSGKAERAMQLDLEATTQPMLEQFASDIERQQTLVNRVRFLSPAIVASEAMSDVAGTGAMRYQLFRKQVASFHRKWRAFFEPKIESEATLTPADYAAMPKYQWQEEDPHAVTHRALVSMLGMLLPMFIVTVIGMRWLTRFSVT